MTTKQEKIFFEIHKDLPREGPGSFESTRTAYNLLKGLPAKPKILDVGCGPGKQTIDLAKISGGSIIALDNHQPYLDKLNEETINLKLDSQISTKCGDMNNLQFDKKSFDIIWAEGSVYIMGIGKALALWKEYLKSNGFIVFSELCWFKQERPDEIENYWNSFYGSMQSVDTIVKFLSNTDYKFIGSYTLPDTDWQYNYYTPLEKRINELKIKYSEDPDALKILSDEIEEINMHIKYSDYYGYSFFVVQNQEKASEQILPI